jgi:Protein of unknown function, DUF481
MRRFLSQAVLSAALAVASAPTGSAQSPACAGGAPSPSGFLLAKVGLSAAILSATQHQQTYQGDVKMVETWNSGCGWPYQRTLFDLLPSYDEKWNPHATPVITRNFGANVQHLFFINSNAFYAYVTGNLYHNNSLGLYLQQGYGGGFGVVHGNLELDADLRFIGEHFYTPGTSATLAGAGLKGSYNIPLGSKGATLNLTEQFVPVFNQERAWYSNSYGGLNIPITPRWAVTVTAYDNYLRNAPYTFRRNYLKSTIGIAYTPK